RSMRMRNPGDFVSLVITGVLATALSAQAGARVIVSTTLNSTLEIFDADSLAELQPPVPSKGGGPVRLWVQRFDWKEYLFAANHGAALDRKSTRLNSSHQIISYAVFCLK